MSAPKAKPDRKKRLIIAIHAEQSRLGIDDHVYKCILQQVSGESSSKDCNIPQLTAILAAIRGQPAHSCKRDDSPHVKKALALWKSLHSLGAIDDPSYKALAAFARRQLKIDALQWISSQAASSIIEPLRDMCRRAGYAPPPNVKADKAAQMLIAAQLSILYPDGAPDGISEWIVATPVYGVIEALGERIRAGQ